MKEKIIHIDGLKVEFLQNNQGLWGYRIHTPKKTSYQTSPGVIASTFRFIDEGKARRHADNIIGLYWMACNEND